MSYTQADAGAIDTDWYVNKYLYRVNQWIFTIPHNRRNMKRTNMSRIFAINPPIPLYYQTCSNPPAPMPHVLPNADFIRSYRAYFGTLLIKLRNTLCKVFKFPLDLNMYLTIINIQNSHNLLDSYHTDI